MALVLLVLAAVVALAAMHSTIVQHKMASNQYDRELAFQSAEAGMRAGVQGLATNPSWVARNCQANGVTCLANPFTDPNLPAGAIYSVAAGTTPGQYTPSAALVAPPQFVIENMGNWPDPTAATGFASSANAHNYGAQGLSTTVNYYRITARSGDPALTGGRAIVTLQSVVKQ